ncbi:MAG: amino acid ABC transporter substrate-binding protein [Flavihumibacter sp.]
MTTRSRTWILLTIMLMSASGLRAQDSLSSQTVPVVEEPVARPLVNGKQVITVLLPLYLDSAFGAGGQYRFAKQFPRYFLPGLEFYEGVQLAIDSLNKEKIPLDVRIIDTRKTKSIYDLLKSPDIAEAHLILAQVANNEIRALADYAGKNHIPFINVNLPNDGGITNNPYMVILNSTLMTHCEGIYKFLQKNYGNQTITVFRKAGAQEDRLKNYLASVEKSTTGKPVKLRYVNLASTFTADQLTPYLDSTKNNFVLAGSLDDQFARNLCTQLAMLRKTYPVQVMGMPTWDAAIRDADKREYKDLEILYTTPFNPLRTDSLSVSILDYFKNKLYARPSDMVFRGYETVYRFGKLLNELGPNIASGLGENKYKLFSDYNIQPVLLNNQQQQLDYFENKRIYVVKILNGTVSTIF